MRAAPFSLFSSCRIFERKAEFRPGSISGKTSAKTP
jgi:hypothetical protein